MNLWLVAVKIRRHTRAYDLYKAPTYVQVTNINFRLAARLDYLDTLAIIYMATYWHKDKAQHGMQRSSKTPACPSKIDVGILLRCGT